MVSNSLKYDVNESFYHVNESLTQKNGMSMNLLPEFNAYFCKIGASLGGMRERVVYNILLLLIWDKKQAPERFINAFRVRQVCPRTSEDSLTWCQWIPLHHRAWGNFLSNVRSTQLNSTQHGFIVIQLQEIMFILYME